MSDAHGKFVWYELLTTDRDAAAGFYDKVVGWTNEPFGNPEIGYHVFKTGNEPIGGVMTMPEEACNAGARPGWLGFIAVDDVDAVARRIGETGGAVHRAPENIPDVGRFAIVADPQGAVFALFKGREDDQPATPRPGTPGYAGWHELMAGDGETVFPFYADLFGWTKADAMDMGDMGVYQLFAWKGQPIGGMMTKFKEMPVPYWGFYFSVADIRAAQDRVTANGGQVLNGPMQVPGGSWIIQCQDPQGVMFSLVEPAPM